MSKISHSILFYLASSLTLLSAQQSINPAQPASSIDSAVASPLYIKQTTDIEPALLKRAQDVVNSNEKSIAGSDKQDWKISPIAAVGVVFDDNIYLSNTNRVSDIIWSVGGGLAFEIGDYRNLEENYLIAQWVGTGYFYSQNPGQNAFNQDASLLGQYRWNQLKGQLESSYQNITGPERQVGAFTTRQVISNTLRFTYDYTDKTSFEAEAGQTTQIFETYLNQYDYYGKLAADYKIFPKIKLGLEGVFGILAVEDSNLQYYQQVRLRGSYAVTGKIDLRMSVGVETREYAGGDDMRITPVFSLGGEYRPFDGTSITLLGFRNVSGSSSVNDQDFIATGVTLGIKQRIQKYTVGISAGYENDTYYGTTSDSETNRVDNFIFVRPTISYDFIEWLKVEVFYEYRNNDSTYVNNAFYDNRVGIELDAKF